MKSRHIILVGGGVVGVTAGIVLRLIGYRVRLVCRHWIGDADAPASPYAGEPRFASLFPAASIFPHSVQIVDQAWHMRITLRSFDALCFTGIAGVRKQRNYEVSDAPMPPATWHEAMPGFRVLPAGGEGEPGAPRRAEDVATYGWSFQTHFAEMPRYRAFLARLYEQLGGEVDKGAFVDADALGLRNAAAVVNCGGAWAMRLFGDPLPSRFVKGILVRVHTGRIPWNTATGEIFSYIYYPGPPIYARPDGTSADLYFYPRNDGWLLGGTRLESTALDAFTHIDPETAWPWQGERWDGATIAVPHEGARGAQDVAVPEPIVTVNREIIRRLTGIDLMQLPLTAVEGYRYRRDPVRLEADSFRGLPVIHNYGHGGAGVTLSWSSALKTVELLAQSMGHRPRSHDEFLDEILSKLIEHCARL